MPSSDLREDVLTFLAFLHAHPATVIHSRFLSPRPITNLNPLLIVRDTLPLSMKRRAERGTQRLRFIHFLCEAAHLVAKTGAVLKPTLRVTRWLAAAPDQQLRLLLTAAFPAQPSRSHDDLWRAYRLPGWSLPSPSLWLHDLMALLQAAPEGERLKLTTLLKLAPPFGVPGSALPEDGPEQPEEILRGVLRYLDWLGVIAWRDRSTVTLLSTTTSSAAGHTTSLNARLELGRLKLKLPDADFTALYELSEYAELIAPPPRRYRLDRARVQQALQRGQSLDRILRFLENAIGDALPDRLVTQLRDWAAPLDQVAVRRVTLLEVKDPATLTDLTRSKRLRQSLQRTLSPRAVVVRESRLPALLRQLDRHGLVPRTNLPVTVVASAGGAKQSPTSTTRLFDSPSLAQLYFAARLNHQLSDQLPAPYRIDYSIILDLAHQLTPHDQLLAAELAEEAGQILNAEWRMRNESGPHEQEDSAFRIPNSELESTLTLIEKSIAANQPLHLRYYTAGRDATTDRVVDPLRLEWRGAASAPGAVYAPGDVPYLIGWCHLRQDERIFRVDRILEILP